MKKEFRKGCIAAIGMLVLIITVIICIGILTDWGTKGKLQMPEYENVEYKIYDNGIKYQVVRHIVLLDAAASQEQIKYLLETFVNVDGKTKMKYHNGVPTHIFIYLHKTKEEYELGIWTNCVAAYIKIGSEDSGKYTYQSVE